jgi:hypothetical protein
MEQPISRRVRRGTLAVYSQLARAHGRSLAAELRATMDEAGPVPAKDPKALLRLSDEALAMTPPDGPDVSDGTLLIRWDRDTQGGKWVDDGWSNDGWTDDTGR